MPDDMFISELICPETCQKVRRADDALIARLNEQLARGTLKNRDRQSVREPLEGGLIREDGRVLYPVRGGIPEMLVEEAIPLHD